MKVIKNVFGKLEISGINLMSVLEPKDSSSETYAADLEAFNKEKDAVLALGNIESLESNIVFHYSVASVIFDIINAAIQQKLYVVPTSPKLSRLMEREMSDFAMSVDSDGEIQVPDSWLKYIDQIMSDDELFNQVALHGEVKQLDPTATRAAFPLRSAVLNYLPAIREGLLDLVP